MTYMYCQHRLHPQNIAALRFGVATLHRTTLNRATVKRRQFIGQCKVRQLIGATGNRVPLHRATHHRVPVTIE